MPQLGVKVSDLREGYISFPSFANYTLVSGSLSWYKVVDEQLVKMAANETFTGTGEYIVRFRVKAKAGITATDSGVASINGLSAQFDRISDEIVQVTYFLNDCLGEKKEVRDIHLRLDEPRPGRRVDEVAERWLADGSTDFHYNVTDISWTPWTSTFEADGTYTVKITVAPEPGYDFADYVHTTLNGEAVTLQTEDYGLSLTKTWSWISGPVTITLDSNGHGCPPDPIEVPRGGCLYDVMDIPENLAIDDVDGKHFYGWSTSPRGGKDDLISFDMSFYEDTTLYAIWTDIKSVEFLYLDPPSAGDPVCEVKLSADKYADVEIFERPTWYTDPDCTVAAQSFEPGGTYYGRADIKPGDHTAYNENTVLAIYGATAVRQTWNGSGFGFVFSVRIPQRGQMTRLDLWADTPVPGAPVSMAPDIYCLNPGVRLETEDWWDSLARVGDYDCVWGGSFIPGKTFYTVVTLTAGTNLTFADPAALAQTMRGLTVEKIQSLEAGKVLRVTVSVKVPEAYGFTVTANGPGRFLFSDEWGLTNICDFPFVRPGSYTLTAFPNPNCTFVGWYDGDTLLTTDRTYSFTLNSNVENRRAVFTETEVKRVDITAPIPRPGDEFGLFTQDAGAVVANGAPVILARSVWYNEWGISGVPLPFEAGRRYFLELDIIPESGAFLTENTKVYINGELVDDWAMANVSTWFACSRPYTMNPFVDVPEGKYYFNAVMWAISRQPKVTGGTDDTHFSPNATCTREQIVTFLYAAYNKPGYTTTSNPFTDVKEGKYYYDAVMWAVENGITSGAGDGKFGVGQPCTREQVVTFLWKAAGSPAPKTTHNPFKDVKAGKYYEKPVLWAVENGITSGMSADTFGVGQPCTRAQVVTFLYKAVGENE